MGNSLVEIERELRSVCCRRKCKLALRNRNENIRFNGVLAKEDENIP